MAYDKGYEPPDWWLQRLTVVMSDLGWDNADLAREARDVDGRGKKWGADRISKMRSESKGTFELVAAVSTATGIPAPVIEAANIDEADALRSWLLAYRRRTSTGVETVTKKTAIAQALDASVKEAIDQSDAVMSDDEGSPRDPRTRRAHRGR